MSDENRTEASATFTLCTCGRTIKPSGDCQNPRCSESAFYDEHWDERGRSSEAA